MIIHSSDASITALLADALTAAGLAIAADQANVADRDAPIAWVGVGAESETAIQRGAGEARTVAVVLIDPVLTADALSLVAEWPELMVLAVVDTTNRAAVRSATDVYLTSRNRHTRLIAAGDPAESAARWLSERLSRRPRVDEVVLTTSDGFTIHGTRTLPAADRPVPAVVLAHSGRSDRYVLASLAQRLADDGLAVLNIDWRGRGRSTEQGTYLELGAEAMANRWRDVVAALDHLAALAEVDAARMATVGVVQGAEIAAQAAQHDPRVRAVVVLTGYRPASDREAEHLTSAVEVLYVASAGHGEISREMRSLFERSASRHKRWIEHPGALLGYQLFETDPQLEQTIVSWLREVLR